MGIRDAFDYIVQWSLPRAPGLVRCLSFVALLLFGLALPERANAQSQLMGVTELKLGGYYPNIDSEFDQQAPFEETFGSGSLFYFEWEWDFYVYQSFFRRYALGRVGVGLHAGYTSAQGSLRRREGGEFPLDPELPGETSFRMIPLRVSAVYRLDYPATDLDIPLVPVFKGGLDYYFWWVLADGDIATADGDVANGGTSGYHLSAGLHFLLDVVEPDSAAYFDLSWGINNSYIFAEYTLAQINDFGSDSSIDLSDSFWMFGLAFEF